LEGLEDAWDDRFDGDLRTVSSCAKEADRFPTWLLDFLLPFVAHKILHRIKKDDTISGDETFEYSDWKLRRNSAIFAIIACAALSTMPIFVLYHISNIVVRLCFTCAFSLIFTSCMATFTSATRSEVFAATVTLALFKWFSLGRAGAAAVNEWHPAINNYLGDQRYLRSTSVPTII
jgi:hypothetical protein